MKVFLPFLFLLPLFNAGCTKKVAESDHSNLSPSQLKAQQIVDKVIAVHGGKHYENLKMEFDFRGRHYKAARKGGAYTYKRIYTDKSGEAIHDVLTNTSLKRTIDGKPVELAEKEISGHSNTINSVIYFVLLPYFLNDPAVIKDFIAEEQINGTDYHKIKVTFKQEGGGKDFEDEYRYWFNKTTNTLDYLAYNFHVNGGGARFRSAYNIRTIKGIRFVDYINYKPIDETMEVNILGSLYQNGGLKELSKIETENIIVH